MIVSSFRTIRSTVYHHWNREKNLHLKALVKINCSLLIVLINVGANLIGFFIAQTLYSHVLSDEAWRDLAHVNKRAAWTLLPILAPTATAILLWLASPVSKAVRAKEDGREIHGHELERARKRALNIPYLAGAMNIVLWLVPSVALPIFAPKTSVAQLSDLVAHMMYNFANALMITLLAFIILENACRWRIIPVLFPDGRLREQAGTIKLNIRSRFLIVYTAICLLPMFQISLIVNATNLPSDAGAKAKAVIQGFQSFTLTIFLFSVVYGLWLSYLFSKNLSTQAHKIVEAAENIREGNFQTRVQVFSNDEIGLLGDRVNDMAHGLQESKRLKEVFDLFASPEVSMEIMSKKELQGGEIREVTILFSDLRGFTTMAEESPPHEVVQTVNSYFEAMSNSIVAAGGIVLQYVGDEIEAVFGAPVEDPAHADKAVAAALAMRKSLEELNRSRIQAGAAPLRHGIGVHTGKALAGIVGGKHKISYAMVGDTVNIASRIQDLTKQMGSDILISGVTYRSLTLHRKVKGPLRVCVQGKTKEVEIFRLLG